MDGQESSAEAQYLQQRHAVCPVPAQQQHDEVGNESQSEHGGHGEHGRKAQHLAEGPLLSAFLVADAGQHGLGHLLYGARNERIAHLVPLGSLRIVAYRPSRKQPSEDKRQQVVVRLVDEVCHQQLAAKSEHPADGPEVQLHGGMPAHEIEPPRIDDTDKGKLLPRQAPVGVAVQCQRDADSAAACQGHKARDGSFAVHHVAEHIGGMGRPDACHQHGGKHQSRQGCQLRLMEEAGYQRGTEEEQGIEHDRHQCAEPEHGIVVAVGGLLQVGQCCREATFLQRTGYGGKDRQHAHHTVFRRRQQPAQHNADEHAQQLGGQAVHRPPHQPFGSTLFQSVTHYSLRHVP